jgi:hypothetical protein
MLSAIPKTPLYERLARENRIDPADRTPYGTNFIPLGMDRDTLRDGYLRVLRALYNPNAYFARLDSLYLEGGLGASAARDALLRRQPLRWFLLNVEAFIYLTVIFFKLQTAVDEADLRRYYRGAIFKVLRRRPDPFVLQAYALNAVMHYHYHKLISVMGVDGHLLNIF